MIAESERLEGSAIVHGSDEFKVRTFEELSAEFLYHYPHFERTIELVPMIYNRLTLIDHFGHKETMKKLKELVRRAKEKAGANKRTGLSRSNIYRFLPADNPLIPHRVRKPKHKRTAVEAVIADKPIITGMRNPTKYYVIIDDDESIVVKRKLDLLDEAFLKKMDQKTLNISKKFSTKIDTLIAKINELRVEAAFLVGTEYQREVDEGKLQGGYGEMTYRKHILLCKERVEKLHITSKCRTL